jgi:hypothetical protein
MPISNPDKDPITKMDKKSTVRMLAAADEILKKLPMLIARRMATKAILRFLLFMIFSFSTVWRSC